MFSREEQKKHTLTFKVRAMIEKLKIESMMKEIQENKNNYSNEEIVIFEKLLQEAIEDYNKYYETYSKARIFFGLQEIKYDLEEILQKYKDM